MATNSLKWWLCIRGWRWMNVQRDKRKTFTEGTRMVGGGDPLRWILHISSLHQLGWCKYCKWASEYYLLLTVLQAGTVYFQAGCWFFLLIVFLWHANICWWLCTFCIIYLHSWRYVAWFKLHPSVPDICILLHSVKMNCKWRHLDKMWDSTLSENGCISTLSMLWFSIYLNIN